MKSDILTKLWFLHKNSFAICAKTIGPICEISMLFSSSWQGLGFLFHSVDCTVHSFWITGPQIKLFNFFEIWIANLRSLHAKFGYCVLHKNPCPWPNHIWKVSLDFENSKNCGFYGQKTIFENCLYSKTPISGQNSGSAY